MKRRQGPVHRAGRGIGPEILTRPVAGTPVFYDLGKIVIAADQDVREAFVVPQQNIVTGTELLDQIRFKKQRLHFRMGGHELHGHGFGNHALKTDRQALRMGIGLHALFQASRLADIEHVAARVEHPVDARPQPQLRQVAGDNTGTRLQTRARIIDGDGRDGFRVAVDIVPGVFVGWHHRAVSFPIPPAARNIGVEPDALTS